MRTKLGRDETQETDGMRTADDKGDNSPILLIAVSTWSIIKRCISSLLNVYNKLFVNAVKKRSKNRSDLLIRRTQYISLINI